MCGYEDDVNALLRDANPGLARRFRPEDAFLFADYTDPQLVHILREKVRMQVLTMARSYTSKGRSAHHGAPTPFPTGSFGRSLDHAAHRRGRRRHHRSRAHETQLWQRGLGRQRPHPRKGTDAVAPHEDPRHRARRRGPRRSPPPGGTRVNQSLLLPEDFDKNPADFSKVRHVAARPTRIGMQVLTAAPPPLPHRCAWRSTTWSTSISSTSTLMSSRRASALLRRYVRLRLRAIACVCLCLICL